jgi:hypothetical protein
MFTPCDEFPSLRMVKYKNVVNAFEDFLLGFFIFKGERIKNDYIINCKPQTCIVMHNKIRMAFFLFKEVLSFSKKMFLDISN